MIVFRVFDVDVVNHDVDFEDMEFEDLDALKDYIDEEYGDTDVNGDEIIVSPLGFVIEGDVWFVQFERVE